MSQTYFTEKKEKRFLFCRHCGRAVRVLDPAMILGRKALCDSCISEISITELLRICEFSSREDLLYSLGFERV